MGEVDTHETLLLKSIISEIKESRDDTDKLRTKMDESFIRADEQGRSRARAVHSRIDKLEESQKDMSEKVAHLEGAVQRNGQGQPGRSFRMPNLSTEQKWGIAAVVLVKMLIGLNVAQSTGFLTL